VPLADLVSINFVLSRPDNSLFLRPPVPPS